MRWLTDKFSKTQKSKAKAAGRNKGKRTIGKRRKAPPAWRKPILLGTGLLGLFGSMAGGTAWLWQSGIILHSYEQITEQLHQATLEAGLTIREVYVTNRHRTDKGEILRALNVSIGQSILTFNPETARQNIEALGWVKSAIVERKVPDRLIIHLEEREPAAIWQKNDEYFLVDLEGTLISQKDVKLFPDLKVITGDDAPRHTAELLQVLQQAPQLKKQVVGAVWVGNRRWNIKLENNVSVRLPEQDPHAAWKRLSVLIKEHELLSREIRAIDLRQSDRLVIRMTDVGAQKLMIPEEDT